MKLVVWVALAACGPPAIKHVPPAGDDPLLLPPLPKPAPINTAQFASVVVCDRCHTAGAKAMRNAAGADISPVTEIQAGMMSLSARDPYFLAALRREIAANPGAKSAIESICMRCHAPVGFAEQPTISLDDLIGGTTPAAVLGREGVGCHGCHALEPATLGDESSFTGRVALRGDRVSFGLLPEPLAEAMVQMSKTKPVPSQHVGESRLCASCHTVLVHRLDPQGAPIGDEIPEQTTFLEWRASAYVPGGERAKTCQGCHMPHSEDELGQGPDIQTPFATRPPDAPARPGYRRHALRGGNSYLLRRLADNFAWLNAATQPELLRAAADATDVFLTSAAQLLVESVSATSIKLTVSNRTGHKLPTGYPTRRMWLHVAIADASGKTLFESGAHKDGALIDRSGKRIDGPGVIELHRSKLDRPGQTMIWESVPVDDKGKRTHLLLGTAAIAKDNRILPMGWKKDHPDAARTRPIGVTDPDFVAGQDSIEIAVPAGAASARFELLYQPIPPETIDSYQRTDSREAARFLAIVASPPVPVVLASKQITLKR
ncbi:MAG: hypothetical protein H0V17_34165 [Deltaproteobacteria bacterium]|nr:hypothetical protein [Deltaproteobacteria bacterium]